MFLEDLWTRARFVHRGWRHRLRVNRPEVAFLLKVLSPGQTAVDAGAHKGGFTYWMCRRVGPSGRVIAFEPIPRLAAYLRGVRAAARLRQLRVEEAALSDESGRANLRVPEAAHLGQSTLLGAGFEHRAVPVRRVSLDDYCNRESSRPVHFVKCDVEGHELELLRGAQRILAEDRPALLVECVDGYHGKVEIREVFSLLERLDYAGYFFPRGKMRPLEEFRTETHQVSPFTRDWYVDFAFLPRDRAARAGLA